MQITRRNLLRVRNSILLGIDELKNQIATCPNVFEYADDIADLEDEIDEQLKLLKRVEAALRREGYTLSPTV
jgi:hypothetical protein